MVHIESEIVINRPVDVMFDFVADERNEPRFKTIWAVLRRSLPEQKTLPAQVNEAGGPTG